MHKEILETYNRANEMIVKLGLQSDLFYDIIDDVESNRDALFILKSHALMEALIRYLLSVNIQVKNPSIKKTEALNNFLSDLSIKGRNSSLSLALNIGIVTQEIYYFIDTLTEIRNIYAHSIRRMKSPIDDILKDNNMRDKLDIAKAFQKDKSLPGPAITLIILLGIQHCLSYACININNKSVTLLGSD